MAFTFGAGTGDDIAMAGALALGADNTTSFVCGWWYPTTLTATRGYWSAGQTFGAEVDGTTSEIRMRTDNTTDGQWLTSGAGITTNKWRFLAFLASTENTTAAGAWRVWVGDAEAPPAELSVSNPTGRSGNYTGSTTLTVGNKGTGTLAFQGDIGWVTFMSVNAIGINTFGTIGTSGAISNDEAENVKQRLVVPFWLGRPDYRFVTTAAMSSSFSCVHVPLDAASVVPRQWSSANPPTQPAATVNGATFTAHEPPRRLPSDWLLLGNRRGGRI